MPLQVLVVEDSSGDIRLTREAFRDVNPFIHLEVAHDGVEAMAFLRQEGPFVRAPRPDLILLDLNLPRMDGRQVLALIKEDDNLKTIPTVILTSSQAEADVVKSYQLQANCYLSKPMHFEAFHDLVKSINDFWLTQVRLPSKQGNLGPLGIGTPAQAPGQEISGEMRGNDEDYRRRRNAN
jgi:two-component system, chemotaxis family, response regulator Rcp1